jgi:CheY-like chemotaxis protein
MSKEHTILVAEDDPSDAFRLKRAFDKGGVTTSLQFVRDGQEAIEYLGGDGEFADRKRHPMPDLMLLDLKMPRLNGFQVLEWVRQEGGLKRLPVVIFSSSTLREDINRAYDLGANSYLMKPHSAEDLVKLVERIRIYWGESNNGPDMKEHN